MEVDKDDLWAWMRKHKRGCNGARIEEGGERVHNVDGEGVERVMGHGG